MLTFTLFSQSWQFPNNAHSLDLMVSIWNNVLQGGKFEREFAKSVSEEMSYKQPKRYVSPRDRNDLCSVDPVEEMIFSELVQIRDQLKVGN